MSYEFIMPNGQPVYVHKLLADHDHIGSVCGYQVDQKGLILTLDDDYVNCTQCKNRNVTWQSIAAA